MLINSGVRTGGGPIHFYGAALAAVTERSKWGEVGALRNFWAGEATVINGNSIANKSGYPQGYLHPSSWCMPPKAGGMSSFKEASIEFTENANCAAGINIEGSSSAVFSVQGSASALAYLEGASSIIFSEVADLTALAHLTGTTDISFSETASLTAKAFMVGVGSILFTINDGDGVALANLSSDSVITFNADGNLLGVFNAEGSSEIVFVANGIGKAPANLAGDTSFNFSADGELQGLASISGSGSILFVGNGVLSALGHLVAEPIDQTLSPVTIAEAVWAAQASTNNTGGSMGEKLNDAGGAGNPWNSLLTDNQEAGSFGEFVQKLLTTAKFIGLK